jgi:hypothetical protein
MAAGAWKIYAKAKFYMGQGTSNMTLGSGVFKMCLHRQAASAAIMVVSTRSTWASITNEISARGSYAVGGKALVPATGQWVVGTVATQYKFTMSTVGVVFTASGSNLNQIKYAVIRNSTGAGAGRVLCFCTLSTAEFTITSPNTLTILPATTGIFTLA